MPSKPWFRLEPDASPTTAGVPNRASYPRLGELSVGARASVLWGDYPLIDRRLMLLGLDAGSELSIESRDRNGDVIVVSGGSRFHFSAYEAGCVRVERLPGAA